jgi:L-lysine 2,3-aminomutase
MESLQSSIELAKMEYAKFQAKKTASAATKARAHLLQMKKTADSLRKQILAESKEHKSMKKKPVEQPTEEVVEEEEPVKKKRTRKSRKKVEEEE